MTASIPSHRLACVLSEIGRLRSRFEAEREAGGETAIDPSHDHSAQFIRDHFGDETAARLVEIHHSTDEVPEKAALPESFRRETYLLMAASRLASAHHRNDKSEPVMRLQNVFNVVDGSDTRSKTYPLRPLSIDRETLFPRAGDEHTQSDVEGYEGLWNGLTEAVTEVHRYETLVHLLEKYTWCIPASPDTPDLPLYDYLRTTVAIGDALYYSDLTTADLRSLAAGDTIDQQCFSLVKGDLSGIQSFLHRMKSPDEAQDRISKRMRGRSTQLWLLTESLSTLFLRHLDLPCTSLIWSGGGQFYALVPPNSSKSAALDEFEQAVNTRLFERFGGDLFFILGCASARQSAASFPSLFQRVARDTDERKLRKGSSVVSVLDSPVLEKGDEPTEPCPVCGGEKAHDEERCSECLRQEDIGTDLPESNYLRLDHAQRADAHFSLDLESLGERLSWRFVTEPEQADHLYSVNSTDRPEKADRWGFVFTGTTVPYGGGIDRVWSFTEQAGFARSDASLNHVVKMDIDDLGKTIAACMDDGVSRLAAISRMLSVFFGGYVNECANEQSYAFLLSDACEDCHDQFHDMESRTVEHRRSSEPDSAVYNRPTDEAEKSLHDDCIERISPIYIGFSGGDDMFFVGPWDEAVEFGRHIRRELRAYCSGTLTISAGYFLSREKYPIGRAVEHAEERLEMAKAYSDDGITKNAAWLFGKTRAWESTDTSPGMTELIDLGIEFEELLETGELSQSSLHAFLELGTETDSETIDPNDAAVGVQKEWKVKYILSRNVDEEIMSELEEKIPKALLWITVPISWASLATR
ncbi:type III-A CRISPR-associated protein Cas10/Csm1 [Halocatena marina]|uniref:type III-A CRISPR-associated protein Cas10/Csm1 n=1 Tax=Halocatena marina TaxID=2934937 RepID=UPI002010BE26|nr:type III-A CRISPR-associated protein Cas10/Csm1 [Halocatena marina]